MPASGTRAVTAIRNKNVITAAQESCPFGANFHQSSWEPLAFYEKWAGNKEIARKMAGAELDMLNRQTKYAHALLKLFEFLLQDEAYVERLKRHYWMFKAKLQKDARTRRGRRKRGRKL
ncbi:MAG: hypothetical protein HY741_25330 [Chloroflexi bacterium]|nr:hypothetical protein [Chloroflexota bacterium]